MLKIRLRRQGSRNSPFYRIVLSDSRSTPFARAVEELGYYDPTKTPAVLSLKEERIDHWVAQGAQLSSTVAKLRTKGVAEEAAPAEAPKAKEAAKAEAAPVEEPAAEEAAEPAEAAADEESEPEAAPEEDASGEEE